MVCRLCDTQSAKYSDMSRALAAVCSLGSIQSRLRFVKLSCMTMTFGAWMEGLAR
jgi:hypothetical protein